MEPRAGAAQEVTEDPGPVRDPARSTFGVRLAAGCLLLTGLAFVQDPGLLVPDTKFDLVLDPGHFLERAAHLWDARGAFGQVQNQAYGYLWPMGSFFWLGALAGIPGWVVQRLWLSLVLAVAFVGAARVSRALGVRSDFACLAAGAAYALSPRMVTTAGPISIEAWPSSVAPWVLLPLILGSRRGSPVRAAALAGGAVAMVGGVNAVATFAVLPLGVVWLLTRAGGPRRRRLMVWWPVFTVLGTAWWLVPLLLMGAYSPPFLDFIESSSITTFPTTVFDSLRGTSAWVPYVDGSWRAGNDLLTVFFAPLNSGVLLLLGVAGLADRRNPERAFLSLGMALGLLLVTFGHGGVVSGWSADSLASLLDGALAPFRNVHKFDPVLRLPLVVGLAWSTEAILRASRAVVADAGGGLAGIAARLNRGAIAVLVVLVVGGSAAPVLQGRLTPVGGVSGVPQYWVETADFLAEHSGAEVALLVPGSGFADYVWGAPGDEPLASLARSRWAVRNAVPLTPPGNIRMLDAIETRLLQGDGSPGLADHLRRAGIRYLVVRNDLQRSSDVPDPVAVHQALRDTPGVVRVATFGPEVGGEAHLLREGQRIVVNGGWQDTYPAVEIFELVGTVATAVRAAELPVVVGGPEDLPDLADAGVVRNVPVRLAVDLPAGEVPDTPVVLTDGFQQRERAFGRIHDSTSAVLTPGDVSRSGNPTRDYLLSEDDRWSTTVRLTGVSRLSASSSMSDAGTIGGSRPAELPFAAIDGSRRTAWVSGTGGSGVPSWRVTLSDPVTTGSVRITGGATAQERQTIRVRTEAGLTTPLELGPLETRTVALPDGETDWVQVEAPEARTVERLTLAEVRLPGVRARRSLVLPELPAGWPVPSLVLLRALSDARSGCLTVDVEVRCAEGRDRAGEEEGGFIRQFSLPAAAVYLPELTLRARPYQPLLRLLQRDELVAVGASSWAVADLRSGPLSAIDGDLGTTWTARVEDDRPTLTLAWLQQQRITGVSIGLSPDAAAREPVRITLTWPGGAREVTLGANGYARFAAVRTDQLSLSVDQGELATSLGFDRSGSDLGVGIGEVRFDGLDFLPHRLPTGERRFPCGSGPTVTVDGVARATSVTASPAEIVAGGVVPATVCDAEPLLLGAGEHEVEVLDSRWFAADTLVLTADESTGVAPTPVDVVAPDPVTRRVYAAESGVSGVVVVRENTNAGWRGVGAEGALAPVTVDGWQQGFDSAGSQVKVWFGPDRAYRLGLGLGLLLLLVLFGTVVLVRPASWPGAASRPLVARAFSRTGLVLVAAGVAGMVAAWPGVAVAAVVVPLTWWARRRHPDLVTWLAGAGLLIAAVGYALAPWADPGGWAGRQRWPHYLALASVVSCLVLAGSPLPASRRPRFRSRWAGFSTRRWASSAATRLRATVRPQIWRP